jgi:hypothetical protein
MSKTNLEKITSDILQEKLFSDFVIDELNYSDKKHKGKEIADILYYFGDTIVIFQLKTRILPSNNIISENEVDRIDKKINEAIGQIKSSLNQINSRELFELKTSRGFKIKLEKEKILKKIGVVIIGLENKEGDNMSREIEVFYGYQNKFNVPIHIFTLNDFEVILGELDTFPDLCDYLDKREKLFTKESIVNYFDELDLLSVFLFDRNSIIQAINENTKLVIEPNTWEEIKDADVNREFKSSIKISYYIDSIIDFFHSSVGYKIYDEFFQTREGSVSQYLKAVYELSSLNRLMRKQLAEEFYIKAVKAMHEGHGYTFIYINEINVSFVFLSCNDNRKNRREFLGTLCVSAYSILEEIVQEKECKKLVGIATEPANYKYPSFDIVILDDIVFENSNVHKENAKKLFNINSKKIS